MKHNKAIVMPFLSPIVAKQRALYGLSGFGAAPGSNPLSGPPVGLGARAGATVGAEQGASIGTAVVPVIGTAIGAIVGAIGGAIAGSINKRDPEQANFDQAVALWQQNRLSVLNLANKYLPLAGLFDLNLKGSHIPIYNRYGRMGEEKFVDDLTALVYNAAQSGKITANDTPQTIMVNVVQPWIDSWGFGPMQDPHADLINLLIMGMIADYAAGLVNNWRATGGDLPKSFASIPPFSLPAPAGGTPQTPSVAAQYAPTTSVVGATITQITAPAQPAQNAPAQPAVSTPQPATVLTADGSSATATSNTAVRNAQGQTFWLGPPQVPGSNGGYQLYLNGTPVGNYAGAGIGLLNGGILYLQDTSGNWWQWTGSALTLLSGPPTPAGGIPATTAFTLPGTAAATTPSTTTVSIPAGYTLVGSANGLAAYQDPNGAVWSWNGVNMTPLTGTLTVSSTGATWQVANGQVVPNSSTLASPSLTSAAQQLYNTANPYAPPPTPVDTSSGGTTAAAVPAVAAPATAGLMSNPLTVMLGLGALGWLIFGQKKRPAGGHSS
jgi:hypothetical protein